MCWIRTYWYFNIFTVFYLFGGQQWSFIYVFNLFILYNWNILVRPIWEHQRRIDLKKKKNTRISPWAMSPLAVNANIKTMASTLKSVFLLSGDYNYSPIRLWAAVLRYSEIGLFYMYTHRILLHISYSQWFPHTHTHHIPRCT